MSLLNAPFDPAREAALVTGAGNGIGRAIAQALVGEGVRTVFADVNRDTVTAAIKASVLQLASGPMKTLAPFFQCSIKYSVLLISSPHVLLKRYASL